MKNNLLLILSTFSLLSAKAQLQITPDTAAINLANALVGSGVNVTNAALNCGSGNSGTFANGFTTNLGMDDGVVLSSGTVDNIPNPSAVFLSGGIFGPGDLFLDTISNVPTHDACVLEFDIVVGGNSLLMDYVFASEEYPEFACTGFNDAFAFQLSGPDTNGGNYTNLNIATVPGTNTPVSINTINSIPPGSGGPFCTTSNSAYYVNNANGTAIAFDGFTIPMTAVIPTIPGQTYHMRYAVANANDAAYDTGVFLEGGSLKSNGGTTNIATMNNTQLAILYPNPSNGNVNVYNKNKKELNIKVYNSLGQSMLQQSVGASTTLDLTKFGAGMYIVNISNGTTVETRRVQVL